MNNLRTAFNKASLTYDNNCKLQFRTAKHLIELVRQYATTYETILDLGSGTGIGSKIAQTKLHYENFFALDLADDLLAVANKRLDSSSFYILADFDFMPIKAESVDLFLANMALHWSKDITNTLQSIYFSLAKGGLLAFALPTAKTFSELNLAINNTSCTNFLNAFPCKKQLIAALNDYNIIHHEIQTKTQYFSNIYTLLRSMQSIGSSCIYKQKKHVSRTELNKVDNYFHYKNHLPKIPLTYQISYFLATKSC